MTRPAVVPVDPDVDLTPGAVADGSLADRPVLVLGLARTGIALARSLHDHGARVTVHDRNRAIGGLLVLPLAVPMLIFGAGMLDPSGRGAIKLLAASSLLLTMIGPFAAGAALRGLRE